MHRHLSTPSSQTLSQQLQVTPRTKVVRRPQRGGHDRTLFNAIVDEALVCHVGVVIDGSPRVLPTAHVRHEDSIYVHGASNNRLMQAMVGNEVAITVTLLDGLVLSRSVFSHSMNFRSAVLYGRGFEVTNTAEKHAALQALVEHILPGRSQEARPATPEEISTTLVVRVPIREGSTKVRAGLPMDHQSGVPDPCWAGEIPLELSAKPPRCDPKLDPRQILTPAISQRVERLGLGLRAPHEFATGDFVISTDLSRMDFALVHHFLRDESYWAQGVSEHIQRTAVDNALCFGLYKNGEQLGFARVVTDFARMAYLGDVFIVSHARGQGLGKLLLESIFTTPSLTNIQMWLLGTRDAHPLYERYGFERVAQGRFMVRRV